MDGGSCNLASVRPVAATPTPKVQLARQPGYAEPYLVWPEYCCHHRHFTVGAQKSLQIFADGPGGRVDSSCNGFLEGAKRGSAAETGRIPFTQMHSRNTLEAAVDAPHSGAPPEMSPSTRASDPTCGHPDLSRHPSQRSPSRCAHRRVCPPIRISTMIRARRRRLRPKS
jgi:hypothetical protein